MPYLTLFPGQEPDEKIIMVLRRHIWIFIKSIILYVVLAFLPFFFRYVIAQNATTLETEAGIVGFNLILSFYYFAWLTFLFRAWLDYYLDIWVITSEHIVNIEQKGLFAREISSFQLYRIQDVTADVKGILPTFFHFGDVHVQTAGAESNFVFKQIPEPYRVTEKLMDLVHGKKKDMGGLLSKIEGLGQ